MANTAVDIYNLALSSVGTRSTVASVDEASVEAETCTRWYQITVDAVLRSAPWPFAVAYRRLALANERDWSGEWVNTDPAPEWTYEYVVPADLIRPRYLDDFGRFALGIRGTTRVLYTNNQSALLCYTKEQPQVQLWDEHFKLAVAHALGANIAQPLHGKVARARAALEQANNLIAEARAAASNEQEVGSYDYMPDWFAVRGAALTQVMQRYVYPNGPMLSLFNNVS